jgi:N-acyl-D-amino-acid deacylase
MALDILLQGGFVVDGTGSPGTTVDVGIRDGKIADVGQLGHATAARRVDCCGQVVCPGFIDMHAHSDLTIFVAPDAASKVHQGVTTEVVGHCGMTPFPVTREHKHALHSVCSFIAAVGADGADVPWNWESADDYLQRLEEARPSVNLAALVGHSALRGAAMGFGADEPTPGQVRAMCDAARDALDAGAAGISFGLGYAPGCYAGTAELLALSQVASEHGRECAVHLRDEGAQLIPALEEALDLGRQTGARIQIDHLKATWPPNWGKTAEALEMLESAAEEGVDVAFDVYPYTAGSRHLSGSLPGWAVAGSPDEWLARLQQPDVRARVRAEYASSESGEPGDDLSRTVIAAVGPNGDEALVGKSVQEIADERGADAVDTMMDLIVREQNRIGVVIESMCEDDVRRVLAHRLGCIATDGIGVAPRQPFSAWRPHPRSYGTYPRFLGHYVRDEGLVALEEGIRKCTSLPAARLGLPDRGRVGPGYAADVVVFEREHIIDTATYTDPHQYPDGITHVLVNGEFVIEGGSHTGARPGGVLRFR